MKNRHLIMSIALVIGLCNTLFAVKIELGQQFSAWLALNNDKPATPRFSLRYQPTISLAKDLGQQWKLDSELSLDMHASAAAPEWKSLDIARVIKPYRLWLRLSSSRFEARLGLQKINFGSATVLRPLMWFDRIDSRDPLQLSYGVYGLLLRYYFKDNANIWLWGLYGNQDTKGWETQATADHVPEFGGRFQAPLLSGEVGLTFHHRCFDPGNDPASALNTEERFALDGKWDLGIGLWTEVAFICQDEPVAAFSWRRSVVLGIDYIRTGERPLPAGRTILFPKRKIFARDWQRRDIFLGPYGPLSVRFAGQSERDILF
jgi:hypothetical protein